MYSTPAQDGPAPAHIVGKRAGSWHVPLLSSNRRPASSGQPPRLTALLQHSRGREQAWQRVDKRSQSGYFWQPFPRKFSSLGTSFHERTDGSDSKIADHFSEQRSTFLQRCVPRQAP